MKSESQIQSECVVWLWNNYPGTRGLFFAVNNNSEHISRAMQRKSIGLVPGVSDCIFMWHGKTYCFEFKTEIGRQSNTQKSWESKIAEHGFEYFIVRSLEVFRRIIEGVIK